jgi:hypothetical protein
MTTPTDQFVDIGNRSQEAVTTAVRTWADTVQSFAAAGDELAVPAQDRRRCGDQPEASRLGE